MPPITLIAIFEIVILTTLLILTPLFSSCGITQQVKLPPTVVNPILSNNPTIAESIVRYSQTAQQTIPVGITFLDEIEQHILILTNKERHKEGLKALQHDIMLQNAARAHSTDMQKRHFFDHVTPEGTTPHDRIAIIHRQLIGMTGENLWQGQGYNVKDAQKLAELAIESWMNSPGHRENMLRPEYTHLGVGGTVKGDMVKLTQNFASTQALFQHPLPLQINSGDTLPLTTVSGLQKSAPVKYGLFLSEQGKLVAPPFFIQQMQINVEPGDYRLRLYFVTSRQKNRINYMIYDGPHIIVK